ncbi:MAG: 1-(5-phosphoribosyl)-5-[(5-phosphoribosylamino)methylideneamino]imidazole-4-carboxamide isomerase [Clostridiales Family XIII bacterium]|jgi:phosphoribosylformimino-5-aminoimidazole carboxamide ribotide isomerase|nr:1-(5-phosphoribosyl)-5-[(5-phosphoribosylamino)methylideneamino]imidazole-4-carboxamide isomerase [Clostridiales Family XIII bacterium]
MVIFPAIDLRDGTPVRLTQGDFATSERVADDALSAARRFARAGATHLHMVDLDGALAGRPVNDALVRAVCEGTALRVEVGGGIRDEATIESYLRGGVWRVILGSVAISDPEFARAMIAAHGERIAIGIDAKDGRARGGGWLEGSEARFTDLARAMADAGARAIIYTDISKDGTLAGPNLAELSELLSVLPETASVVASGGIATIEDVRALAALGCAGAICGKSIYKGTLRLEDALAFQETS